MTDPLVAIGDGLYDAFEWGYAQGKKDATKWISVNERLPERFECVLTYEKGYGVKENRICGDGASWWIGFHVTHWMPLPEPPKDGDQ